MKECISFKGICSILKKDYKDLADDADALLSLLALTSVAFVASPLAALAPGIGLLAEGAQNRDAINSVFRRVITRISDRNEDHPIDNFARMESAYVLTCYAAFFEALQSALPDFMRLLNLTKEEQLQLSAQAIERIMLSNKKTTRSTAGSGLDPFDARLVLPHPADTFEAQRAALIPLYAEMAGAFLKFLETLKLWENATEEQRTDITQAISQMPEVAVGYFDALYFALSTRFNEFYIWSKLQEVQGAKATLSLLTEVAQEQVQLSLQSSRAIDVGFGNLLSAIQRVPVQIDERLVNVTLRELNQRYINTIDQPIVRDTESMVSDSNSLRFPARSEIFIPQAFKVIRYKKGVRLESEQTWTPLDARHDLAPFLLSYLSSPVSEVAPLVILGHPGSGKSLLTSMLSARLVPHVYTPIRVELRGINAENEVPVQIEEQIRSETQRAVSWATLTDHFRNRPPVVMLDGYDELLQASGKVFAGYLLKVQKFQENELSLGRPPVRAIVTSRVTLIDKADIPYDSTIVRLLEFDEKRQRQWVSVWNRTNRAYFTNSNVAPFSIPNDWSI